MGARGDCDEVHATERVRLGGAVGVPKGRGAIAVGRGQDPATGAEVMGAVCPVEGLAGGFRAAADAAVRPALRRPAGGRAGPLAGPTPPPERGRGSRPRRLSARTCKAYFQTR